MLVQLAHFVLYNSINLYCESKKVTAVQLSGWSHARFTCTWMFILIKHITNIQPFQNYYLNSNLYIKIARCNVTRTVHWQSINIESRRSRKWGKSSCLTKLNSRSMKLMQYPVSHSPHVHAAPLFSKKQWGWRDHTIIELSRVGEVASKGEGSTGKNGNTRLLLLWCGRELVRTCPHAHLLPALIFFYQWYYSPCGCKLPEQELIQPRKS